MYLSGMRFGVSLKMDTKKTHVQIGMDYVLKHDNHLKLNSHHNCRELYDHLMETILFFVIMNDMLIRAPKTITKWL